MVSQQLFAELWIHAHLLIAPTDPQTLCARRAFLQLAHYTEPSSFSLGTSDRQLEICQQDSGMAIGAFASDLS
jgi:hypothetical protein